MQNSKALDLQDMCKTVRIHTKVSKGNPEGITEINFSDYNANIHKLVDEDAPALPLQPSIDNSKPLGTDKLLIAQDVGAKEPLGAGMIVGLAHEASGMSIADWNSLSNDDREVRIFTTLKSIRDKNGYKPKGPFG